ncbi:hypothetical protein J437_LFUL014024 [Ladona fulva]|uniref:DNA-directed DNA polymerase n=1 Tax=Ladona fulva TaxID=123851 RepID=A0A8K0KI71_LADFU|nr:hypothetical protein J437_LFUL014024 [Ladona fulva]
MVKGFFPHFFNTKENSRYVGPIPAPEMYGVDSMSTKDKAAFLSWHGEISASGYVFSMEDEIRKYCVQDVRILRYSCLRFHDILVVTTTAGYRMLPGVEGEPDSGATGEATGVEMAEEATALEWE